jgi:hypothetical protein
MVEFVVRRLREEINGTVLADLFSPETILVPAPGSAPLRKSGGAQLWPTKRLCDEMVANGFGTEVVPLLSRVEAVPKSAYCKPGEPRPGPQRHAETIAVSTKLIVSASRIVIVDDVLTRGATMLGCASRLTEVYPDIQIIGFALARTDRDAPETPISPAVSIVSSLGPGHCDCHRLSAAPRV